MRKQSSTRHDVSNLSAEEKRRRTFDRAVKLLTAKPRSAAELRQRLLGGRGASKPIVEEVINRLREYGYLDDERYALGYATSKIRQRAVGRQRLQRDLMLKRVDREVAEEALDTVFAETPEEVLIDRAIEKHLRQRGR